ncbi:hypothetical protein LOTGIDRAFT_157205 [Lottia gigantea]|uniref:Uncharacterized protein n=1 Tax=Lottia gigantea TaxID=225164 RepID=V4ADH6_LOTGI|nr:hypothetical protein LOTGIDRAFT_157205 [Lottia gigantea]ESP02064.1 hypothetical protein LOTGIDRAFT_157205 [Lottia gigantea]
MCFVKYRDYLQSPTVGSKSQLNDGGRITFEINSLSNWLLLSDAYFRCDFKIKDGTQNQLPQTNTTLENNFFPSLFSEMVLEAGSNAIETIKHPGEFDTMLKTVLYPKDFNSVSGWIPDVGDGSVLKEPVRNVANDADLDRVRVVARNTIERVARAANHGFEKRVLQYNNIVENNRWGNYVNWKLYPLFGLLEHRKVSIGLPHKIHLQREINDDKIFFGENGSDAKLEKTNLQLFIPVITPSFEVETRIFNSLTKDIEIAFLLRNTCLRHLAILTLQQQGQPAFTFKRKVSELDSFIRPAMKTSAVDANIRSLNRTWLCKVTQVLIDHYQTTLQEKLTTIRTKSLSSPAVDRIVSHALSWARRSYGKRLTQAVISKFYQTINETKTRVTISLPTEMVTTPAPSRATTLPNQTPKTSPKFTYS